MNTRARLLVWLILLVFVVAMSSTPAAGQTGPVKIGAIQPLTGWAAEEGAQVVEGAKIAIDRINAAGGVKGRKLELLVEDGKADPTESRNAVEKLTTRDKVSVIFGAWLSSATLAIMPVVEKNQVPLVVETSGAKKITQPMNKWVFRFAPTFAQEAAGVEKCLLNLGFKNVAFLAQNNDWGRGSVEEFSKVLEKQGAKITSVDYVAGDAIDFYSQLTKIKNSNADSILFANTAPATAKLLQQAKELGLTQKVLATGMSNWTDQVIRLAGPEAAEGSYQTITLAAFAPDSAPSPTEAKVYVEEWKKRGRSWDGVVAGSKGYDAILVIARAIELADGSSDRPRLRDALERIDMMGVTARIKFDANHDAQPNIVLAQAKSGKAAVVKCR